MKRINFSNVAAAESELREALQHEDNLEHKGELLTQLGRARGLQGEFEDAMRFIDQARSFPGPRVKVFVAMEHGRVLNSSGHPEEALPLFIDAYQLAIAFEEFELAADAAHMVAIASPLEAAEEWTAKGLELAAGSDDPDVRRWRGPLWNNIGWSRFESRDYEGALAAFTESVRVREERPDQPVPIRIAKYSVAKALRHLGRSAEAVDILREIVRESNAEGDPDGYFLAELAFALGPSHPETENLIEEALHHLPDHEVKLRADLSDF